MKNESFAKTCLQEAFVKLLSEYTFDEITITDISLKAGVSRTTFYRLYTSKEDLLKEIKINTLKNTYATVKTISSGDINKGYVEFYKKVYDCRNDIKVYAKAQILNYNNFVDNNLIDNIHIELGFKDEFEKAAYLGALGALAARWIRNDFKETPEEMAQITIRTIKLKANDHE